MQVFAAASMLYCDGDHHAAWLQVATNVLFDHTVPGASTSERGEHHDDGAADTDHDADVGANHHDDTAPDGDDHSRLSVQFV
jgi:hypothetical protein